jgi:hypothetical protein
MSGSDADAGAVAAEDAKKLRAIADGDMPHPGQSFGKDYRAMLRLLASADAERIRIWFGRRRVDQDCPFDKYGSWWPMDLLNLALCMSQFSPIDEWQRASASERKKLTSRVAALSRALAAELRSDLGRTWRIRATDLFDEAVILNAKRADPHTFNFAEVNAWSTRGEVTKKTLFFHPDWLDRLDDQDVPSLLDRLSNLAESREHDPRLDARPNTGDANQRASARWISRWFDMHYGRVPNSVVADVVNLMQPTAAQHADESLVRDWRGVK